jgi:long-chain fatty acid transport protein
MKRTIKLAVAAAMALSATSAFATNGDHLIGIGAKTRGMGGAGIAMSHGAESSLANPAMITGVKGTEISFGGTVFMPNVDNSMGQPGMMAPAESSDADMSVIPSVSLATELGDGMYIGVGMWGTAGMGVDYRGDAYNFNMVTNLQLMQFGVPVAYETNGLSVSAMPLLQYGALDIDYSGTLDTSSAFAGGMAPAASVAVSSSAGVAQDLAAGYILGAAYDLAEVGVKGLTVGAVYKSAIEMDYEDVLTNAVAPFQAFGLVTNITSSKLEQPAEIGAGLAYNMGEHTIAIDYKRIKWESAEGYKEFGWEDQDVLMVGYEYATEGWAVRAGYNHASNCIPEGAGNMDPNAAALNMFNLLGFPGIVESHVALGGTYVASKNVSFDVAYTRALETEETYEMGAFAGFGPMNPTQITTTHSQDAVSFAVNFNF